MRMTVDTRKLLIDLYIHVGILCTPKMKSPSGVGSCRSQALLRAFLAVLIINLRS